LILGIAGVWKSRKLKIMEPSWKPPIPMTANTKEYTNITGLDKSIPLFFRLHYFIRGSFFPCGAKSGAENTKKKRLSADDCSVLVKTSIPHGDTSALLLLNFPISGIFHGEGGAQLRDIFGFFSFPCGSSQFRTVKIRSTPCFGKKIHINAQSGAEDKRQKQSADDERYYMREYTPGDRLRDINWKSSDRIDTLITRISTDTQEKISRIEIHFRNYRIQKTDDKELKRGSKKKENRVSLEELWLLDRAKARLMYFLRSIKDQNSSFIFDVHTAQGNWEIEDDEDLETFFEELAGLSFMPSKNETISETPQKAGEVYIFSTACDIGLPAFLLVCNPRPITLFISQPAGKRTNDQPNLEIETLCIGDFDINGCTPSFHWLVSGKVKPLNVHANKMEINYTEVKL
jgi:hypothetical protein